MENAIALKSGDIDHRHRAAHFVERRFAAVCDDGGIRQRISFRLGGDDFSAAKNGKNPGFNETSGSKTGRRCGTPLECGCGIFHMLEWSLLDAGIFSDLSGWLSGLLDHVNDPAYSGVTAPEYAPDSPSISCPCYRLPERCRRNPTARASLSRLLKKTIIIGDPHLLGFSNEMNLTKAG
mgnify:CR=1 FL=1